jgi:alkaline phosphatase D
MNRLGGLWGLSIRSALTFGSVLSVLWPVAAFTASADFAWSGAVTPTTARVKAHLPTSGLIVRCAVSADSDFTVVDYAGPDTALSANGGMVDFRLTGLAPSTRYYYAFEVTGVLETDFSGRFRTFAATMDSFSIVMGSCAQTGSNHPVFSTMAAQDPLFMLHLGDMHYQNIAVNDVAVFRAAFQNVWSQPNQRALYLTCPIEYIWDDHDYGPNNSDSTAPGRLAARLTYQECVPHYDLAAGSGNIAIYRSFAVGRAFFIVTDCRSARSPDATPDGPTKTMLGATQRAWLKQELLAARDVYPLIVWANSLPWIGASGSDAWQNYTYERREIADFLDTAGIDQLCMVSGDAHMLAIDDGTNSGYATSGAPGFPVFHAAALDQSGSVKGGPYSEGTFPGGGQFGLMTVVDKGDSMIVNWSGRNAADQEIVSHRFAMPATASGCGLPRTGDIDASGSITASDIIALVNYTLKGGPEPNGCAAVGDANCTGHVTSADVIVLVNYVFKAGPAPCDICALVPSVWPCDP